MTILKLISTIILVSVISSANATLGIGDEPKLIAKCDHYQLFQYKHATFFSGVLHMEHRYQLINGVSKETLYTEFESHSEGANIKATEIYEHNPNTGAAIKYRKLSIVSWNNLFYMDVAENSGTQTKLNCTVVR